MRVPAYLFVLRLLLVLQTLHHLIQPLPEKERKAERDTRGKSTRRILSEIFYLVSLKTHSLNAVIEVGERW